MCGRFTLRTAPEVVAEQFALCDVPRFAPRFNIAPTQPALVVRMDQNRRCDAMRWGLIPSWARDASIGARLINARSETAAEKPAFRAALRRRRCLVPADGFYEWRREGRSRRPYFIHRRDDRPFALAGLWESWEGPDHAPLESFTILTTEPNELIAPLHDRMPVILAAEAYDTWLDPTIQQPDALESLLVSAENEPLEAVAVGLYVNNAKHEGPLCIEPEG